MDPLWRTALERQLGGALAMLENALRACPEDLWGDRARQPEFWYSVYHTLFFLDLHLSGTAEGFAPPPPFNLDELDPRGLLPDRVYGKDEMQRYLDHCRTKLHAVVGALTDEGARRPCAYPWGEVSFAEVLVYATRHVQHHAAQLNLVLRHATGATPGWVSLGGTERERP